MESPIATFVTDEGISATSLARALEERDFESLFVPEQSHIPSNRETPYPGGGDLPHSYYRSLDPFVALSAAAAVTEKLVVGTSICQLFQRDPIHTAKSVSSVDQVSRGRFIFGVAGGWNREEMRHHGTEPRTRFALMRERVLAMKELWTQEEAEFHGEYVDFSKSYQWPKPVQTPHPPVLIGGMSEKTIERVLEYGDGWMPNMIGQEPEALDGLMGQLRHRADELGQERTHVTLIGAPMDKAVISHYRDLGIDRCALLLPTKSESETLGILDMMAGFLASESE